MNILNTSRDYKRLSSKALPLVKHEKLWVCVMISQESANGKWSLFWGGNNKRERSSDAVGRELKEELGGNITIVRKKDLWEIETRKTRQRIFAVLLDWEVLLDTNEILSIGYYPLEERHSPLRKKLEGNMDYFAIKALQNNIDRFLSWGYNLSDLKIRDDDTQNFERIHKNITWFRWIIQRIIK